MPRMPKWLGDFSEKTFKSAYKKTIITEVEYYATQLKRIRYQGEELKSVDWRAAQEVEFRVSETEYRHYTPLCWNNIDGYTDVLFFLHGQGPGSHWAARLALGDEVNLIGPAGKFVLPADQWNVVMMGDETTLSAFKGMKELLPIGAFAPCILELDAHAAEWPGLIGLSATVLKTIPQERGRVQMEWLRDFLQKEVKQSLFFLSGNATTIKDLRKLLLSKKVPAKNIFSKPYWMEGKAGL